jgi:hypothetical protein
LEGKGVTLYIYSVATWTPVHAPCCRGFNTRYEKVRTYVEGVYLSKELAKVEADRLTAAHKGEKYWVARHKVRDSNDYVTEGANI